MEEELKIKSIKSIVDVGLKSFFDGLDLRDKINNQEFWSKYLNKVLENIGNSIFKITYKVDLMLPQFSYYDCFSSEELLLNNEYWNFVCDSDYGYSIVKKQYEETLKYIQSLVKTKKEE